MCLNVIARTHKEWSAHSASRARSIPVSLLSIFRYPMRMPGAAAPTPLSSKHKKTLQPEQPEHPIPHASG